MASVTPSSMRARCEASTSSRESPWRPRGSRSPRVVVTTSRYRPPTPPEPEPPSAAGPVGRDAEGRDRGGQHAVVADQQQELDRLAGPEVGAQRVPGVVGEVVVVVELVDRGEDGRLS